MRSLILAPVKACLGEHYPGLRNRVLQWEDTWIHRITNAVTRLLYARSVQLDEAKLAQIKRANRQALRSVSLWGDPALLARSIANYGLSPDRLPMMDAEIGSETTLSDLVGYYCAELPPPTRYLEIGVSLGKNFVQVMNLIPEGSFSGFDLEDINPAITRDLRHVNAEEWPAMDAGAARQASGAWFARQSPLRLDVFVDGSGKKTISYVAGDVFDERCWQVLGRQKYNLIFSDALHTGPAIRHEYAMMKKYDIFDRDRFVIVWDDLHFPGMRQAFLDITADLASTFNPARTSRALHLVYGWGGAQEPYRHLIGVFQKWK